MDITSTLISEAKKGMCLQLTLINGFNLSGEITDIDSDGIILRNKDKLAAAALTAIVAWQLDLINKEEEINIKEVEDEYTKQGTNISEDVPADDIAKILDDFHPEKDEHSEITLKKHINKAPQILLQVENDSDKKKWDSILSRYQNASKNDNLGLIEALADELIAIGNSYPGCGIFYYNAACFKVKGHNYPDASELFDRALKINQDSDYAYNTACAYLLGGDKSKALAYLGIYFCMEYFTQDVNLWHRFCSIAKDKEEYYIFSIVFNELISKYYQLDAGIDNSLELLLKSALYVFTDVKDVRAKIITFFTSIEDADNDTIEEKLDRFIDEYNLLIDKKELCKSNVDFDCIYSLLNGINIKGANEVSQTPAKAALNIEFEEGEEDISFTGHCPTSLNRGHIYRVIPPYKYGFLKDENGISYHFKYDSIFDNIGYLDGVTEDNLFPVLFKAMPSTLANSSTDETATFICSFNILDNIIKLAQKFSKERDYPNAILELDNVLEYDPDNTEANKLKDRWTTLYEDKYKVQVDKISFQPQNPSEWKAMGDFLLNLGMHDEAIDAFNKSSENMSGSSSSWYGRGIAYLKTKRYEKAIECLSTALKKNPPYYHASYAISIAYNRLGKYKEAIEHSENVINVRLDYKDAWEQKAFSLSRLGKYDSAIDAYDMVLNLDPEDWVALSKKSSVLIKQDNLVLAMKCINKVLSHLPEHPDSLFTKGYIYQKQSRYQEALEYFERSLVLNSSNVKALTKKAYILAIMGEKDAAIQVIQDALNLKMSNPKTWYYKGVVHHYAEEYEEAIAAYQSSLKLEPGVQRVIVCKERAEKKLEPSIELVEEEENEINDDSGERVEDLILALNQKYSRT
jgi:tetratricopeptide (TPR) repeat protein